MFKRAEKFLRAALALAYLGAGLAPLPLPASASPVTPGMACSMGVCHCKMHKPGQVCCCLLMHRATARPLIFKKGDPPCVTDDCGGHSSAPGSLPSAKAQIMPGPLAPLSLAYRSALGMADGKFPPSLPSKTLDKVPLSI
jgi:hypothetical protein